MRGVFNGGIPTPWTVDVMAEKLCFFCDRKPRVEGDVACRSCLQEHRMCYECGERERNFPFKLCTTCYAATQADSSSAPALPARRSALVVGIGKAPVPNSQQLLLCLNKDQSTYKEIAQHFEKEWVKTTTAFPNPPQPSGIFAIQNHSLVENFHQYGDQIRKSGSGSANSDLFFHGTTLTCDLLATNHCCNDKGCGVCGISRNGFDASRIGSNIPRFKRFGHGIYLAPNSSKCHDYTQGVPEYGVRAQLLCLVACGAQYELRQDNTTLEQPPSQFHSVYGRSGGSLNYDEIVVYDVRAVLPQFVVVYSHDGVHKIAK